MSAVYLSLKILIDTVELRAVNDRYFSYYNPEKNYDLENEYCGAQ